MSISSLVALERKRAHLYQPPSERQDTCAHCKHSTVTLQAHGKAYRCPVMADDVKAGATCAVWAPVTRWIQLTRCAA